MNIPQVETNAARAEPRFTRARSADAKGETFTVPEDDGGEQAGATASREEVPDAPTEDSTKNAPTPDVSAWVLAMLVPTAPTPVAPEPPAPPPDLTDPSATLAPAVQVAPQDPSTVAVPSLASPEATAKSADAPAITEPATTSAKTSAVTPEKSPAAAPPTKPAARADNVPTPPSTPIVRDRTIAENAAPQAASPPRVAPPPARVKSPSAGPEKSPVVTREPLAPPPHARVEAPPVVPGAPWVQPSVETTRSDNALTSVSAPTPALTPEGADPVRSRLQGALTTSMNQRALQGAAHGEVVLPDLGRVAVQARTEHGSVEIAVQASQAATSQALHARADQIAADVRAADIPVSRMSFESAGTWTPSHTDTAPREQRADTGGSRQERDASPAPRVQGANGGRPGRVRIVL